MNIFEEKICEQLSRDNFVKVQQAKIGIAGLGGLGSNCAMNLVRSGFKKFKLIDCDKVENKNLNRQFYFHDQIKMFKTEALSINLLRINKDVQIDACTARIEEFNAAELFLDCDIVVEAFDEPAYKSMLVSKIMPLGKLIVAASGLAGIGKSDEIKTHWIKKNLVIIGDLNSDVKDSFPISPKVNIAAAKQADIILEYVITSFKSNESSY